MGKRINFMQGAKVTRLPNVEDLKLFDYVRVIPINRGFTEIRKLFKMVNINKSYICGGYARYCASPMDRGGVTGGISKPKDIDIYSYDEKAHEELRADLKTQGYRQIYDSPYSVTMGIDFKVPYQDGFGPLTSEDINIQLIKPDKDRHSSGLVNEVIDYFDFTVCQAALISPTEALVGWKFEEDESLKMIRLSYQSKNAMNPSQENKNPMITFHRCMKYAAKGYKIKTDTIYRIFGAWGMMANDPVKVEEAKKVFEQKYMSGESGITEATKYQDPITVNGGYGERVAVQFGENLVTGGTVDRLNPTLDRIDNIEEMPF